MKKGRRTGVATCIICPNSSQKCDILPTQHTGHTIHFDILCYAPKRAVKLINHIMIMYSEIYIYIFYFNLAIGLMSTTIEF